MLFTISIIPHYISAARTPGTIASSRPRFIRLSTSAEGILQPSVRKIGIVVRRNPYKEERSILMTLKDRLFTISTFFLANVTSRRSELSNVLLFITRQI